MKPIENRGLISVIIPIYNVGPYLQRCLNSIYRNTYKNLEIICVNDGSTDNSPKILNSQRDKRVIILNKENGGVSSARNAGLKIAKGEYISFIDPDDWVHSKYFELLHSCISGCEMSVCGHQKVSVLVEEEPIDKVDITVVSDSNSNIYDLIRASGTVWGKLYTKSIVDGIFFCENVSGIEDKIFNIEVFSKIKSAAALSTRLYYYYNRPDSITHTSITVPVQAMREVFAINERIKSSSILKQTYRMIFACRYLNMFTENATEISREASDLLAICKKNSKVLLEPRERLLYNLLAGFPMLYRLWRIAEDPTLLDWERLQREKGDRTCR